MVFFQSMPQYMHHLLILKFNLSAFLCLLQSFSNVIILVAVFLKINTIHNNYCTLIYSISYIVSHVNNLY